MPRVVHFSLVLFYGMVTELVAFMAVAETLGEKQPSLLHYFWTMSRRFDHKDMYLFNQTSEDSKLYEFGLIEELKYRQNDVYRLSESGKQFLLRLRQKFRLNTIDIEKYIILQQ